MWSISSQAIPTTIPCRSTHDAVRWDSRAPSSGPRIAAIGARVFDSTPNLKWKTLSRAETHVALLLDGVTPVTLLEEMTLLSREELHATLALLHARGAIVERQAEAHDEERMSVIPLSTLDFIQADSIAPVVRLSTADFIEVRPAPPRPRRRA